TLRIAFFSSFILEEAATMSTAVIAVEIGLRLLVGQMPFQPALFILLVAPEFFQPLRQLGAKYHAGMNGSVALRRIHEIIEVPLPEQRMLERHSFSFRSDRSRSDSRELAGRIGTEPVVDEHSSTSGSIDFAHVDYTYDGQRP